MIANIIYIHNLFFKIIQPVVLLLPSNYKEVNDEKSAVFIVGAAVVSRSGQW